MEVVLDAGDEYIWVAGSELFEDFGGVSEGHLSN